MIDMDELIQAVEAATPQQRARLFKALLPPGAMVLSERFMMMFRQAVLMLNDSTEIEMNMPHTSDLRRQARGPK